MNKELQLFARQTLKSNLAKCSEDQQHLFKRMYAGGELTLSIDEVVYRMPEDKLDWAMTQVETTLTDNLLKRNRKEL